MMNSDTIFSSSNSIVYEDNAKETRLVEHSIRERVAIYRDFLCPHKQNRGISFVIMQYIFQRRGVTSTAASTVSSLSMQARPS